MLFSLHKCSFQNKKEVGIKCFYGTPPPFPEIKWKNKLYSHVFNQIFFRSCQSAIFIPFWFNQRPSDNTKFRTFQFYASQQSARKQKVCSSTFPFWSLELKSLEDMERPKCRYKIPNSFNIWQEKCCTPLDLNISRTKAEAISSPCYTGRPGR